MTLKYSNYYIRSIFYHAKFILFFMVFVCGTSDFYFMYPAYIRLDKLSMKFV